ncbi:MAG: hypothetical protein HY043_00550 [Verrucomicrobia bacterium]|nr:hypothetical protein [Verrucomicrobiota bacterium]
MKRRITILIGLLGVFVAVGLILPALAKVRDYGSMPSDVVVFYTLGVVLAIAGIGTAVFGLRKRQAA